MSVRPGQKPLAFRLPPPPERVVEALQRLSRERALHSLVRWALPVSMLRGILKEAMPRGLVQEMPPEAWGGLAVSVAMDTPLFRDVLAVALHERLAWDREPSALDEYERLARERPLEALWMAALSEAKPVRKAFPRLAEQCLRSYRSSPTCTPPSWDYVEALHQFRSQALRDLEKTEKAAEAAARDLESERVHVTELREELKRLRRENADLRGEKAQTERRAEALASRVKDAPPSEFAARQVEDLERRLRKAEKEKEHFWREVERLRAGAVASANGAPVEPASAPSPSPPSLPSAFKASETRRPDPGSPRRRVVLQILRKLVKKGKIGSSHSHLDSVYRGVADHEKGLAKEAVDLLQREGYLMARTSGGDALVSLSPERVGEVRSLLAGEVRNSRLSQFLEGNA
jgi:hypothetical protein